jgi:hypothetical protein
MANLVTTQVKVVGGLPVFVGLKSTAEVFSEDLSYPFSGQVVDPVDFYKEEYRELATGTADEAIDLGQITTVRAMLIKSDQPVSLEINAGTVAGASGNIILMIGCAITALTISNASGNVANVKICLAGE